MKWIVFLKEKRWLEFPRAYLLCVLLAVVIALPGLGMGFFVDDYFHIATLEGGVIFARPFDLFLFSPGDPETMQPFIARGPLPWWTLPEFKAHFLRPLSSSLIMLDHALFGRTAVWYHVHSVCWYLLLILVWGVILRKTLPGSVAVLALVIFAVDEVHWFPTIWLANRNALVAVVPALFGLYAHIRWREEAWKPGLPLSLAGYAVGLSGGETALGILAYLGAYELFGGLGSLRRRALALLPALLLGVVYILIYKTFGFGSYGSGSYIDPMAESFTYLCNAPARILALLAGLLLSFSADLWLLNPSVRLAQVSVGVLAVVLFAGLLRRVWNGIDARQRRALKWMIPGALLSLLPVAATFPSSRLLLTASLGGSTLVAVILAHWWPRRKPWRARLFFNTVGYVLVAINLIVPVVMWPAESRILEHFGQKTNDVYLNAEIPPDLTERDRVVLLVAADPMSCLYPPIIRQIEGGYLFRYSWLALSAAPSAHRITRTDAKRLEVEVLSGSMLATEFECLVRTPRAPYAPGDQVDLDDVMITIIEVNETGPTRVAFEFDRSLDDPTLHFIVWKDNGLRRVVLPAVGESMLIPRSNGLLSSW